MTDIVRCDSCGVAMAKDGVTDVDFEERGRFTDEHAPLKTRKFGMALHINPIKKVRDTPDEGYTHTITNMGFKWSYDGLLKATPTPSCGISHYVGDGFKRDGSGHLCPRCRARLLRIAASKLLTMADNYDRRKSLYLEESPKPVPHGRDAVHDVFVPKVEP